MMKVIANGDHRPMAERSTGTRQSTTAGENLPLNADTTILGGKTAL
jgi:hypothetical protein